MTPTFAHSWRVVAIWVIAVSGVLPVAVAQEQPQYFESDVASAVKPWTNLDFFNNPENFKFAIVSDRTGGLRPGVFADAVKKLNLLMPEFVMSVGDFIPGNTSDRARLEKEWAEFDAVLKPLKVPFFFVPGNHDINNDVMRDVWNERSGVPFYSFVYKNVLFLALDTTGEKGDIVPEYQVEYVKRALEKYGNTRWVFVFMHHPLWLYDDPAGFAKVERLLEGRQYTVIAGHFHRYLHEWRNNANYYVLATTGGGSELRGPRYGEFDHVTFVTVTDAGPVIANLRLDGILPHNVTTRSDYELTEALVRSTELPYTLFTDDENAVGAGTLYLEFRNPSERELQVKARFAHSHELQMNPRDIAMTLAPKSERAVAISIQSREAIPTEDPALLQLDWTMGFEQAGQDELFLSGTRNIPLRPSHLDLIQTVAPEFVKPLSIVAAEPAEGCTIRFTTDGSVPTVLSSAYERPFDIFEPKVIKARLFNNQGHGTATCTQSYRLVSAGVGFRYRLYKGGWTRLPDYSQLEPVFGSVATDLNVESRQMWPNNWGMVLEGDFPIDQAGEYTFYLNSDDGSKLYIDDQLIVDNDGDHSLLELKGVARLSQGIHKIRIDFFEAGGEAILQLDVEGPGMERQSFPVDKVSHRLSTVDAGPSSQ